VKSENRRSKMKGESKGILEDWSSTRKGDIYMPIEEHI